MSPQDEREAIARVVCEIVVRTTCPDYASEASIQGGVNESWHHWTDTAYRILALRQPGAEYRRGVEDAARELDRRAENARVAAIGGGMDPMDASLLDYEYSNAATAIRALSDSIPDTKGES